MSWMNVGDVQIARVLESNGPFQTIYEFFPDATAEALEPHLHWLHQGALCPETDKLILPIQSYVVRTPQSTVLVDSCVGNHKSVGWFPEWDQRTDDTWERNLQSVAVRPEEIDVVLCTHLHVDHSGWNTRLLNGRWVPTFPNARYVLSRRECDSAEQRWTKYKDPVWEQNVLPIIEAGQADLVNDDHEIDRLATHPGTARSEFWAGKAMRWSQATSSTARSSATFHTGISVTTPTRRRPQQRVRPFWNATATARPACLLRISRCLRSGTSNGRATGFTSTTSTENDLLLRCHSAIAP
jgi:hypothetical protein